MDQRLPKVRASGPRRERARRPYESDPLYRVAIPDFSPRGPDTEFKEVALDASRKLRKTRDACIGGRTLKRLPAVFQKLSESGWDDAEDFKGLEASMVGVPQV